MNILTLRPHPITAFSAPSYRSRYTDVVSWRPLFAIAAQGSSSQARSPLKSTSRDTSAARSGSIFRCRRSRSSSCVQAHSHHLLATLSLLYHFLHLVSPRLDLCYLGTHFIGTFAFGVTYIERLRDLDCDWSNCQPIAPERLKFSLVTSPLQNGDPT